MTGSKIFRVVGPPGTGKTTFLAAQAQRAAEKHGPDNVVAVSLTRTAAAEIAGRDSHIPDDNCSTLHAAAFKALEQPAMAETAKSMREFHDAYPQYADDSRDLGEDAGGSIGRGVGGALHAAVTNRRARMDPMDDWTPEERDYNRAWVAFKMESKRRDFTDLIEACLHTEDTTHPAMPRVILADEVQDFSRLELELLKRWAAQTETTVVVGDSQQAIFQFRGADPEALDALDVAGQRVLEQSYRVPAVVHEAATLWVSQLPGPQVQWLPRSRARTPDEGDVIAACYALRDTDDVIGTALCYVECGKRTMILATCRYMLNRLVTQLRDQGIPFGNVWAQDEAQWNPLKQKGAKALTAYLRPSIDNQMWTWGDLEAFTDGMRAAALARGAREAIEEHCRIDQFGTDRTGDRVPLDVLRSLLGDATASAAMDGDINYYEQSLLARAQGGVRYPREVLARYGREALTAEPLLTVSTVHGCKGGEADHVIFAPDLSKEAYWSHWLQGGEGRNSIIRLGYVACTRARESLTILEPGVTEYMPIGDVLRHGIEAAA